MLLVALLLPLGMMTVSAQGLFMKKEYQGRKERACYMQGAVTEESGKVVFRQTLAAPGKTKAEVLRSVQQWAALRYEPNMSKGVWTNPDFFHNFEYAAVTHNDVDEGVVACQADEEMVFTNKALSRDWTRLQYVLTLHCSDEQVEVVMSNIVYTYTLTESNAERLTAEEWISDGEAFSKKGELLRRVERFRIKTIDLKDQLVREIGRAVGSPVKEEQQKKEEAWE